MHEMMNSMVTSSEIVLLLAALSLVLGTIALARYIVRF
jgi:hypothetical protein